MLKYTITPKIVSIEPVDALPVQAIEAIRAKMGNEFINLPTTTVKSIAVNSAGEIVILQLRDTNETYRVGWSEISSINGQDITGYTAEQINDLIKTGLST